MLYSPVEPMHIPDGFLSIVIAVICWVITIVTLGIAISRTNKSLGERQVPLMGVMAAFIFAAQMINFPVAGGTSGHLLGGALAAITLGSMGWHVGDDRCHRRAGIALSGWRLGGDGREHSEHGLADFRSWIWFVSLCDRKQSHNQTGSCWCGGMAFCDDWRTGHLFAIMVKRHSQSSSCCPGDVDCPCIDRIGRSVDHGCRVESSSSAHDLTCLVSNPLRRRVGAAGYLSA